MRRVTGRSFLLVIVLCDSLGCHNEVHRRRWFEANFNLDSGVLLISGFEEAAGKREGGVADPFERR